MDEETEKDANKPEITEIAPGDQDTVDKTSKDMTADEGSIPPQVSNETSEVGQTPADDGEEEDISEVHIDPAVIEKLTNGVLGLFLPNLQKAKGSLNEVLHNQEVLLESIQQENAKFNDSSSLKDLIDTMQQARVYHSKLLGLKKEMTHLMDKSTKLKRRAVKLQQQKKKEELNREQEEEKEQQRERALAAKIAAPVKNSQKSTTE